MIVKICGITNGEDALAAVTAGASALGLNFYPRSPRFVTPELAAQILRAVPPGVLKVGVFVNEPAGRVSELASALGLDVVQLYGDQAPPTGIRVWRAVQVEPSFSVESLDDTVAEAFVLDPAPRGVWGGAGTSFDWRLARTVKRRIIIAGGLDESNVRDAIRLARPWGVDACSRLERAPGLKDHARMARFIREAWRAFQEEQQA